MTDNEIKNNLQKIDRFKNIIANCDNITGVGINKIFTFLLDKEEQRLNASNQEDDEKMSQFEKTLVEYTNAQNKKIVLQKKALKLACDHHTTCPLLQDRNREHFGFIEFKECEDCPIDSGTEQYNACWVRYYMEQAD